MATETNTEGFNQGENPLNRQFERCLRALRAMNRFLEENNRANVRSSEYSKLMEDYNYELATYLTQVPGYCEASEPVYGRPQNCCESYSSGLREHLGGADRWSVAVPHYDRALEGNHQNAKLYKQWIHNGLAIDLPLDLASAADESAVREYLSTERATTAPPPSARDRGVKLIAEYSAIYPGPINHLWHAAHIINDAKAIGCTYQELQTAVRRVGPVHNVLDPNGIPIPGCIRERDANEAAGWWTIELVEFNQGKAKVVGAASDPLPALVTQRDVDVALWLAFFEGIQPVAPSFSLDRAGDGTHPRRLDRKTFNPPWLATTEFGQSMYFADWLMKSFTMRDGLPSLTDPTLSGGCIKDWKIPKFLEAMGTATGDDTLPDGQKTNHSRLEIVVKEVELTYATCRRWLSGAMHQYRVDGICLDVESSLYTQAEGMENGGARTHYRNNDPATTAGSRAQLLKDNYEYAGSIFPVFTRVKYILALFNVFCQARRDGVILSETERRRIQSTMDDYKREYSQSFQKVEYSPKQFHKGGCYCSGGVSGRDQAKVTHSPLETIQIQPTRIYVTYTKEHEITGEIYTGRTSGFGKPEDIVRDRDARHHVNEHGFKGAVIDVVSASYAAIRGREELMIQKHGGPQRFGGNSGNRYSGISDNHSKRAYYLKAALGAKWGI